MRKKSDGMNVNHMIPSAILLAAKCVHGANVSVAVKPCTT